MAQAHPKKDVELPRDLVGPMQLMEELAQAPEAKGSTPIPSKATMLFVSAMSAVAKKNIDDALKKLQNAVHEGEKETHKEPHAIALLGLGYVQATCGEWAHAESNYAESVVQWTAIHGEDSPKLARILADTATVYEHGGHLDQAEVFLTKALKCASKGKGEKSPEVQGLICGLGNLLLKQNRLEDAEQQFATAVSNLKDPAHPSVTFAMKLLHSVLVKRGKTEEAAKVEAELNKFKEEFAHKKK